MIFKKAIYKNGIYCGTYTDREKVISDFLEDLSIGKPTNVKSNKRRLFVYFRDSKYLAMYDLPIAYKKYVENGGKENV